MNMFIHTPIAYFCHLRFYKSVEKHLHPCIYNICCIQIAMNPSTQETRHLCLQVCIYMPICPHIPVSYNYHASTYGDFVYIYIYPQVIRISIYPCTTYIHTCFRIFLYLDQYPPIDNDIFQLNSKPIINIYMYNMVIYLSIHPSMLPSTQLSSLSIFLFMYLLYHLSKCLSIYIYIYISIRINQSIRQYVHPAFNLSIHLR